MYQTVTTQHLLATEQLEANITLEGLVLRVGSKVILQVAFVGELSVTDMAGKCARLQVLLHMHIEVLLLLEVLAAHMAAVAHAGWTESDGGHAGPRVMLLHMLVEVQFAREHLVAYLST